MSKLPIIFLLLLGLFFFRIYSVANAAAVSIEPSHFEINGRPGNVIDSSFRFSSNPGTKYEFSIRRFEADGTRGLIKILPPQKNDPLNEWVQFFPRAVTSTSTQDQIISFRINVPETAPEQDHYFVILATPIVETKTDQTSAVILPGIATNLILSLFDKTKAQGEMKVTLTGSQTQVTGKQKFNLVVQNNLNKFQTIEGGVEITNTLTKKSQTIAIIPFNVLSGASREMSSTLEENIPPAIYTNLNAPGVYQVKATIAGDSGTKYSSSSITLILLPSLQDLALPIFILTLIVIFVILFIKIRRYPKNK